MYRIRDYIDIHFAYEQRLFAESRYKFTQSHIRGHRRFVARLDSFRQRFDSGACIGRELHNFLHRWLVSHIARVDRQYVPTVMTALDSGRLSLSTG
ncbi:MAG: hemerythrin domain-containing protein [Pseudomonadota bacterium]